MCIISKIREMRMLYEQTHDKQWHVLQDQLKILKEWCTANHKMDFYNFFEMTIKASYGRYRKSKISAWSVIKHILQLILEAILPAVTIGVLAYYNDFTASPKAKSILCAAAFALIWISIRFTLTWTKKKNATETWTRHSACFQHLHNVLAYFLFSERTPDNYQKFVSDTFSVLEQNIDQFTLNMSGNGLAERKVNK